MNNYNIRNEVLLIFAVKIYVPVVSMHIYIFAVQYHIFRSVIALFPTNKAIEPFGCDISSR